MQEAGHRVTAWFLPASTVFAAAALAAGYGLNALWGGAAIALVVGAFWLTGQWRRWGWVTSAALVLLTGAAAMGLWLGVGGGWALVGVVAALVAWDLDRFAWRMRAVGRVEDADALERRHLWRLLAVCGVGLLLGAVALGFRIQLGFAVAFVLALLAVLGLSRLVGFLRREGD
jgi:hypothetical protein